VYEIIIHGRGGQGALLAARVLANAYFFEEKYVEAFPYFGGERRGAPVRAFLRFDDKPIRMKTPILSADCAIILDASLLDFIDVSSELKEESLIIINTPLLPNAIKLPLKYKTATCNATEISLRLIDRDIPNSAMLGAFAHATGLKMDSLIKGFYEVFPNKNSAEKNIAMAKTAANETNLGFCEVESKTEGKRLTPEFSPTLNTGGTYKADGSSLHNVTSSWTPFKAVIDEEQCNLCLLCYANCPEGCILRLEKGLALDEKYCKGCGICETVCPRHAIKMQRKKG